MNVKYIAMAVEDDNATLYFIARPDLILIFVKLKPHGYIKVD